MTQQYATLEGMQWWAQQVVSLRKPNVIIGEKYLKRWHIVPRNKFANVYLHVFGRSDDDRAMHDHPWPNQSYIIEGRYVEHTPEGSFMRVAGDFVERLSTDLHRIELVDNPVVTLFTTGPKVREWGFQCPEKGWIHWSDFCAPGTNERGPGCE